jgi:CrcB protein
VADRREILAVCAGGFIGALARALLSEQVTHAPGAWPWATFAANLAGAFVLGYVATLLGDRQHRRRLFVGTGFCGALTTFSTLQIEIIRLGRDGHEGLAGSYLAASLVAGLLTMLAVSKLVRRARLR